MRGQGHGHILRRRSTAAQRPFSTKAVLKPPSAAELFEQLHSAVSRLRKRDNNLCLCHISPVAQDPLGGVRLHWHKEEKRFSYKAYHYEPKPHRLWPDRTVERTIIISSNPAEAFAELRRYADSVGVQPLPVESLAFQALYTVRRALNEISTSALTS